ncbi:acyltransferase [Vibrio sp. ZSDE26]|uniref:Acyltransferase n=1 Tax=Vibrio amylolyticus TaxID=2847292 RepID=A0A9X1XHG9_9VIBR|nr:acyltransferase family protein [Vibrio amylolyticus]MCK6263262.1 acyltransferase [Vibrio amylolyticus]
MLTYRKELDGLRALAVIAVIAYHANLQILDIEIFKGGYLGVDVFFVLSGYLITAIVRNQMSNGTFSLPDFYWRRAKRIVPAFIFVLAVTSLFSYLILTPSDLINFANSLKSSLYFGSNHYFYSMDSYTSPASIYQPLLHTWSLSVEWQFYLIFPFVIWGINKLSPNNIIPWLVIILLVSLQSSIYIVNKNPDMAFYFLFTRAWELIIGGIITFYDRANIKTKNGTLSNISYQSLPSVGLFLIIYSFIYFDHNIPHPSLYTIIPIIGTCLFITFSKEGELSTRIFSSRPMVLVGIISFSLYLWHQPVFVFFRLLKTDTFQVGEFFTLLFISIALATITYRHVESRYRKRKVGIKSLIILVLLYSGCFAFSKLILINNGLPERLGPTAKLFKHLNDISQFRLDGERCHARTFEKSCTLLNNEGRNIILLGDSHAGTLGRHTYLMSKRNEWGFTQMTHNGCIGFDNVMSVSGREELENEYCTEQSKLISKFIDNNENNKLTIIFSARIPLYIQGTSFDNTQGGVEIIEPHRGMIARNDLSISDNIVNKLSSWASLGHEIVLVYPIPEVGWNVSQLVQKELSQHLLPINKAIAYDNLIISTSYDVYQERTKESFTALNRITGNSITRIFPDELFCSHERCHANDSERLFYFDDDHLSTHGASLVIDKIERSIK